MGDDLTDEQLMAIWDDESGTPPPMTAAEMDHRLEAANERRRLYNDRLEARTRTLEDLRGQYSAVLERLEAARPAPDEKPATPGRDTEELRRLLKDLAEQTSAVAASL